VLPCHDLNRHSHLDRQTAAPALRTDRARPERRLASLVRRSRALPLSPGCRALGLDQIEDPQDSGDHAKVSVIRAGVEPPASCHAIGPRTPPRGVPGWLMYAESQLA